MKKFGLLAVTGALVLAGCVTPFRAPADVAHIELRTTASPVVTVPKIWLERKKGPLVVKGYVDKRAEATDTTGTHLDVILYDGTGHVLRQTVEQFEPRQIPRRYRGPTMPAIGPCLNRCLRAQCGSRCARMKVSTEGSNSTGHRPVLTQPQPFPTMKTFHKTAALLLLSLFLAGANAQPAAKQYSPTQTPHKTVKTDPRCSICEHLAKANPPVAAQVRGRAYDPNRACHRELRFTPTATGKGPQTSIECACR